MKYLIIVLMLGLALMLATMYVIRPMDRLIQLTEEVRKLQNENYFLERQLEEARKQLDIRSYVRFEPHSITFFNEPIEKEDKENDQKTSNLSY